MNSCVNFFAVSLASCTNMYVVRRHEKTTGVSVNDPEVGQDYGKSKTAAGIGINLSCSTRVIWNVPIFFTAPAC